MAKCLSNWRLIQAQMAMIIAMSIVMLALSGYTYQNNGGDFSSVAGGDYSSWENNICKKGPYMYLVPFSFTITTSSGQKSDNYSFCGYPRETATFRFVITVFAILTVLSLYIKTPISIFGRYIYSIYGVLFYSAMVLDSKTTVDGNLTCLDNFTGTDMADVIRANTVVLTCNSSNYEGVILIDLVISIQFLFLATSWSLCQEKYPTRDKAPAKEQKMETESTKNPMVQNSSNIAPSKAPSSSWMGGSKTAVPQDNFGAWA